MDRRFASTFVTASLGSVILAVISYLGGLWLTPLALLAAATFGLGAAVVHQTGRRPAKATGAPTLGARTDRLGTWALGGTAATFASALLPPLHTVFLPILLASLFTAVVTDIVGIVALVRGDDRGAAASGLAKAALPTLALAAITMIVIAWLANPPNFSF